MAIKREQGWDDVKPFGQGNEFQRLPKGGYICRMIMAEEKADKNGNPMIHIAFDIIEGDYKNYFMDLYNRRKENADDPKSVKYPFEGQAWIPVLDYEDKKKNSRKFKGFCTALEDSGQDIWTPDGELNLNVVKSAEIGVIFQDQEQEYNGKTFWKAIPWGFRSLESIATGDIFVPDDKPLDNSKYPSATDADLPDSFSAAEDSIPF